MATRTGRTDITTEAVYTPPGLTRSPGPQRKTRPRARFFAWLDEEAAIDQRPATTRTISSTLLE